MMPIELVNRDLLEDNDCFGCGHLNGNGLKIEVSLDPQDKNRLIGRFSPKKHMIGFPGITHGGVIYTALDCLASWTPTILRSEIKAAWILHSANIRYLRPAREGMSLFLAASIKHAGKQWEPVVVRAVAKDEGGRLLAEGRFKVVPLTPERLKTVSGIEKIPENWRRFLSKNESATNGD